MEMYHPLQLESAGCQHPNTDSSSNEFYQRNKEKIAIKYAANYRNDDALNLWTVSRTKWCLSL